jgi:hypothetical protein
MSCDNSYFSNRFSGNNYAIAYIPEFFEHEFKLIQGQFWGRLSKNYEDDFVLRPPMDITSCKKNKKVDNSLNGFIINEVVNRAKAKLMTIPAADLQTLELNKSTLQKAWGITDIDCRRFSNMNIQPKRKWLKLACPLLYNFVCNDDQETFEIMYQNFLAQAMERIWEGIADNKDRLLVSKNLCLD